MLSTLPHDAISEILSWVPVKPLCRFRCVSKGWHALISSPTLVAVHKTRSEPLFLSVANSNHNPLTFLQENSTVLRLIDMDGNILRVIEIPDLWTDNYSVDGSLCFTHGMCVSREFSSAVNMMDLATGNLMSTSKELNNRAYLSPSIGYAVPSRTYKAVCLMSKCAQRRCEVLTVEDGAKWRQTQSPPNTSLATAGYNEGSPVTLNGVMHFLYKFETPQLDEDYVFRFDLETEEWKAPIKGPTISDNEVVENKTVATHMTKLKDALCMVQRDSMDTWLIWLLTDAAKGTWVKLYTLPMASTIDFLMPLTVMRDGQKLLFCARNKTMKISTLQVYDPLTRTCTHPVRYPSNLSGDTGLCNLNLECFVSPKIFAWGV